MKKYTPIFITLFVLGCAQAPILTGGPTDTYAPAIDSAKTSPYNGQINFEGDKVQMKFDEYIILNKPLENILITPQPSSNPVITSNKKKLNIQFTEPLLDSTTYTITFNKAIQDITEKNDSVFQYVFSTGDFIDSLEIEGTITDAYTNVGLSEFVIGLYPADEKSTFDSIPFKDKPMYLAQSNKGTFKLNYLKEGEYYLFAYDDVNGNLKLDSDEQRAFLNNEKISLYENIDSISFRAFSEENIECKLEEYRFLFPGRLELILSAPADTFSFKTDIDLLKEETDSQDSLVYWLSESPYPKIKFYVNLNGELDTLKPVFKGVPDKIEDVKLVAVNNIKTGMLLPNENLKLIFSEPIGAIDQTLFHVFDKDSVELELPEITSSVRELEMATFGTSIHQLVIDSGAVTSVFKRDLMTPLILLFDNHEADYFSTLIVSITGLENSNAIVQLVNKKGLVEREVNFEDEIVFKELIPGDYTLRIILDEDENGIWTTGSLWNKLQPEKMIYYAEGVQAKSKWEKEIDWIIELK